MSREQLQENWVLFKRSMQLIHSVQPWMLPINLLAPIIWAIHPFVTIYMTGEILDAITHQSIEEVFKLAVSMVCLDILINIIRGAINQIKMVIEARFYIEQKQMTSNKLMELDYESIEDTTTHEKLRRVNDMHEVTGIRLDTLPKTLARLQEKVISIIIAIGFAIGCFTTQVTNPTTSFEKLMNSPIVTVGFVIFIATLIGINVKIAMKQRAHQFKLSESMLPFNKVQWYYNNEYLDTYTTGREIRLFKQDQMINQQYDEALESYNKACIEMGKAQGKFTAAGSACSLLSQGLIYLYVSLKTLVGAFGIGSITKYVGAIHKLYGAIEGLLIEGTNLQQVMRWLKLYWELMDTENVNYKGSLPVEKRDDNDYEIAFHNVSFKYPGQEEYVLRNVSLKLKVGERLAVVGMNGSGKTTMIKLLCRLYDPTEGEITLNGINIKKYDWKEYISIFSVVFQDFKLFSVTLGQNVSTDVDYDKGQVEKILKKCGLSERLEQLEQGIDTYVYNNFGEQGVEISGGEAQKIALARALYKDAPFIILDEPTAALDPIAEFEVYTKFNELVGDKTTIYISHRLSSCRFCDKIVVFHEGKIVEEGTHDTLTHKVSGKYQELWHAQAQYYAS